MNANITHKTNEREYCSQILSDVIQQELFKGNHLFFLILTPLECECEWESIIYPIASNLYMITWCDPFVIVEEDRPCIHFFSCVLAPIRQNKFHASIRISHVVFLRLVP